MRNNLAQNHLCRNNCNSHNDSQKSCVIYFGPKPSKRLWMKLFLSKQLYAETNHLTLSANFVCFLILSSWILYRLTKLYFGGIRRRRYAAYRNYLSKGVGTPAKTKFNDVLGNCSASGQLSAWSLLWTWHTKANWEKNIAFSRLNIYFFGHDQFGGR